MANLFLSSRARIRRWGIEDTILVIQYICAAVNYFIIIFIYIVRLSPVERSNHVIDSRSNNPCQRSEPQTRF